MTETLAWLNSSPAVEIPVPRQFLLLPGNYISPNSELNSCLGTFEVQSLNFQAMLKNGSIN